MQNENEEVEPPDRARQWVFRSLSVHLLSLLLYPTFICGCHFRFLALVVSMIPMTWATMTLLGYESKHERLLAYSNMALAMGWLYLAWESNIRFAFIR